MIKTKIFDEFVCLADKCTMTCCKGWSIRVEQEDMEKWRKSQQTAYLCEETTFQKHDGEVSHQMKLDACKACVLLDEKGLCEVVKRHGDGALSKTCAEFPRKHHKIYEMTEENEERILLEEYSLSGACPGVLALIQKVNESKIVEVPALCRQELEFPMEYRIRNMVLYLLQETSYALDDKLMLCFDFLHECLECEWEDEVYDCIEVYLEEENQEEHIAAYHGNNYQKQEAFMELCQTFFDVTQYYKEEEMYRPYLTEICTFVEERDGAYMEEWEAFKESFAKQDTFLTKVIAAEIFSDCVSDDVVYFIESFQSIVMEYVMTRLSLFLKQSLAQQTSIGTFAQLTSYLSLYIRMIGHNVEGMAQYWEENFEDSVLEQEYLYLLLR